MMVRVCMCDGEGVHVWSSFTAHGSDTSSSTMKP